MDHCPSSNTKDSNDIWEVVVSMNSLLASKVVAVIISVGVQVEVIIWVVIQVDKVVD